VQRGRHCIGRMGAMWFDEEKIIHEAASCCDSHDPDTAHLDRSECVPVNQALFTLKSNHRPPYRLQLLTLPPSYTTQIIIFTSNNMLSLSWWAYFLILSVGAGALALALLILFRKRGSVLFTSEVDAEFHRMAESARVIRHQRLAHQRAQEIARNHRTTLLRQPSIELDTIITTPHTGSRFRLPCPSQ